MPKSNVTATALGLLSAAALVCSGAGAGASDRPGASPDRPGASPDEPDATTDQPDATTDQPDTASKAITDEVLEALSAELERAEESLRIPGAPEPYRAAYKVTEVEAEDAAATLGAATAEKRRHFATLDAFVHVGDYELDNTNFVMADREDVDGNATARLPVEENAELARHAAWRATDRAYKEAIEQMSAKTDAIHTGAAADRGQIPSYSRAEPVESPAPVLVPELEPRSRLEERAREVSRAFEDEAHVRDSRVSFTSFLERRWYLNTEGALAHDTRRVSGVIMVATARADDGQHVSLYDSRYGFTEEDLPSNGELVVLAEELSEELAELADAPSAENYTGPVLFEGAGAAGLVRETLAPELRGTPLPAGLSPQARARIGGGALAGRIGLRATSPILSVVDDPTLEHAEGRPLIGGYQFDDEGVPAERVEVIEDGELKNLLMSRVPSRAQDETNGHARLAIPGGVYHGSTTNLLLSGGDDAQPREKLRAELLEEVEAQGLDYGVVIRRLDDPHITANAELSRLELFQLLQGRNPEAPEGALSAYRIYPDGSQEPIRGLKLDPIPLRAWRDVIGASEERTVFNYLENTENSNLVRMTGSVPGFVPSAGVESAIVTPDLLFEELDLLRDTALRRGGPALPAEPPGG